MVTIRALVININSGFPIFSYMHVHLRDSINSEGKESQKVVLYL